jgi:hypothetical protein
VVGSDKQARERQEREPAERAAAGHPAKVAQRLAVEAPPPLDEQ